MSMPNLHAHAERLDRNASRDPVHLFDPSAGAIEIRYVPDHDLALAWIEADHVEPTI